MRMKTNYDNSLLQRVIRMGIEAKSHYNDGWVMNGYKEELLKIRDYISNLFPNEEVRVEENPNQLNMFEDEG